MCACTQDALERGIVLFDEAEEMCEQDRNLQEDFVGKNKRFHWKVMNGNDRFSLAGAKNPI